MFEALKAGFSKLFAPTTWYGVAALAICLLVYYLFEAIPDKVSKQGQALGQAECVSAGASAAITGTVAAVASAASQTQGELTKADQAGTQHERSRKQIDNLFRNLETEARHDPPNPVDACVLPPDRLRRWAAANAGPASAPDPDDQGQAASQRDTAAPSAAATEVGLDARSGSQPPRGGQGISPTRVPGVQPVDVPGDRAP